MKAPSDNGKLAAQIFGRMCAAFARGAGTMNIAEEVPEAALDRYYVRIVKVVEAQVWSPGLSKRVTNAARKMGLRAAAIADDESSINGIEVSHFKRAADEIEPKSRKALPRKSGGSKAYRASCDICGARRHQNSHKRWEFRVFSG